MESREAADVLIKMLEKKDLASKEREAVKFAIGVLAWTALGESKIKRMGAKKRKTV
jgi:hypothetical protein